MKGRLPVAILLPLAAAAAFAPPLPAGDRADRSRAVAGWRIQSVAEDDGGRIVRITRRRPGYIIDYHRSYWHGNGRVFRRAEILLGNCARGGEEGLDGSADPPAREVHAALAARLDWCGATPRRIEEMLYGFDRAFAAASLWARQAEAATAAEAAAIARYGEQR